MSERTPAGVRLYLLLRRVHARAGHPFSALFSGFWLGAFSRESLHALDDAVYRAPGSYVNDEHNLRGLFPWEAEALEGWFRERHKLLLVGAGGGREAVALARRGVEVDAYECNPALVEYANRLLAREGLPASVRHLPRDEAPAEGGPYDGAIVGWSAYMLIQGRERRVAFLRGLRARMAPGAPLLLSFWTRAENASRIPSVARVANAIRRVLGRESVEPGDDLFPNYLHHFTEREVAGEMASAGFSIVRYVPHGPGPRESGWAVGLATS
jgi:2-polyprenyl-3-methyl-5-hydroxy-6-metoxy-1,4-benzoquinol methylase